MSDPKPIEPVAWSVTFPGSDPLFTTSKTEADGYFETAIIAPLFPDQTAQVKQLQEENARLVNVLNQLLRLGPPERPLIIINEAIEQHNDFLIKLQTNHTA